MTRSKQLGCSHTRGQKTWDTWKKWTVLDSCEPSRVLEPILEHRCNILLCGASTSSGPDRAVPNEEVSDWIRPLLNSEPVTSARGVRARLNAAFPNADSKMATAAATVALVSSGTNAAKPTAVERR